MARRFVPRATLWAALVVLALAPNRAATRLWFATGPIVISLALGMVALGLLFRGRPRLAAVLLFVSTMLYEGGVCLVVAIVALWVCGRPRERLRSGATVIAPTVLAAGAAYLLSSKRNAPGGPAALDNLETFVPGQVGLGLWGVDVLAVLGGSAILLVMVVAAARQLPSFRSDRPEYRWICIGSALAVVGAVPYAFSGSFFATAGVFDRNNLVPGVGVALVLGAAFSALWAERPTFAAVIATSVVLVFSALQVVDFHRFGRAVDQGEAVVAALGAAADEVPAGAVLVVVPAQPNFGGVSDFIYSGDLSAALRHRTGRDLPGLVLVERIDCAGFSARHDQVLTYDWERSRFATLPSDAFEVRCTDWQA